MESNKPTIEPAAAEEQCRQLKTELRSIKDKYELFFRNIQDIYFEILLDGTILEISPSIELLFQYKREEIIGKSVYEMYFDDRQRADLINAITKEGKVYDYELTLKDRDGNARDVSVSSKLIIGGNGIPDKIVGILRDISQRKKAENDLIKSNQFNQEIIANANEGIVVYDKDLKYIVWNPFMEDLTGLTAAQVLGKKALNLLPHLVEQGIDVLLR
jgi:PAS domain S-box-containing protein